MFPVSRCLISRKLGAIQSAFFLYARAINQACRPTTLRDIINGLPVEHELTSKPMT
jgi:hypothetical protein